MIIYLIKSCLVISVFWVSYTLFLRPLKSFGFNRMFLLIGMAAAVLTPLIQMDIPILESTSETVVSLITEDNILEHNISQQELSKTIAVSTIILLGYYVGLLFMMYRVFISWKDLYKLSRNSDKVKTSYGKVRLIENAYGPFSFFNSIYMNREEYASHPRLNLLLLHEAYHIKMRHTIDNVIAECLSALLWFLPIMKIYKRAIRNNHEYMVDEAIVREEDNRAPYLTLLLERWTYNLHPIGSNLDFTTNKNRIMMMKNQIVTRQGYKQCFAILTTSLFCLFLVCNLVPAQAQESNYPEMALNTPDVNITQTDSIILPPPPPPPPPPKLEETRPSQQLMKKWREETSKFGIFLDSKRVKNKQLDNISIDNIFYFNVTEPSKKWTKGEYQYRVHLVTNQKAKKINDNYESNLKKYHEVKKLYELEMKAYKEKMGKN